MPAIIFDLWFLIMRLPLKIIRIVTRTQYWTDETRSIDSSRDGSGMKLLSGSTQETSLSATKDFSYSELDPHISRPFLFSYRFALLLAFLVYMSIIFKISKYTRQRILDIQDADSTPLTMNGRLYPRSLQGEGHSHNRHITQKVELSEYADNSYDGMIQEWCDKSWVTSQTDISELHGNSIRFKRTPNTAHITEDFKTTRSAAISLLLWDCK